MKAKINKINGLVYVTSEEKPSVNEYGIGYAHGIRGKFAEHYLFLNDGSKVGKINALCADARTVIATNNKELPIQQLTDEEVAYCECNEGVELEKEKYSERFDNNNSPIGNTETWGKRYKLLIPKDKASEIISICGGQDKFKELANLIPKEQTVKEYEQQGLEKYSYEFKEQETIEQLSENYINMQFFDFGDLTHVAEHQAKQAYLNGAKSQQPIIDQLKKDNGELLKMLQVCKEHLENIPYKHLSKSISNDIQQLIQKHNKK